jgi:hypothetical protein
MRDFGLWVVVVALVVILMVVVFVAVVVLVGDIDGSKCWWHWSWRSFVMVFVSCVGDGRGYRRVLVKKDRINSFPGGGQARSFHLSWSVTVPDQNSDAAVTQAVLSWISNPPNS